MNILHNLLLTETHPELVETIILWMPAYSLRTPREHCGYWTMNRC